MKLRRVKNEYKNVPIFSYLILNNQVYTKSHKFAYETFGDKVLYINDNTKVETVQGKLTMNEFSLLTKDDFLNAKY